MACILRMKGLQPRFARVSCPQFATARSSYRFYSRATPKNNKFLSISDEVRQALSNGKPVVALETTIYTHGFPYPDNGDLASSIEDLVRQNGAVPAHIGVLDGRAIIGMTSVEMDDLLKRAHGGFETLKLSRRDLGYIAGQGQLGRGINGGTTIAGTLVLAHLAGIQVFATGGLGGVHKGGEVSMDVSADLTELGRTPVALVSSGCKSFLDIPRTLEYLETQGVGVGTFADGRDGKVEFPAFWTRNSGTPSPRTIKDEDEAAAIIYGQTQLGLQSGLLFANPISEQYSLAKEEMDQAMAQAVKDADDAGVTGFANTPYVLSRIREITQGKTIAANRELVFANVIRGAKVASRLAQLQGNSPALLHVPAENQRLKAHQGPNNHSAPSINAAEAVNNQSQPDTQVSELSTIDDDGRVTSTDFDSDTVVATYEKIVRDALDPTRFGKGGPGGLDPDLLIYGQLQSKRNPRGKGLIACNLGHHAEVLVVGSVAFDLACDITQDGDDAWTLETSNRATIKESVGGVGGNIARAAYWAGAKTTLCSAVGKDTAGKALREYFAQFEGMHVDLVARSPHPTARYVAFNSAENKALLAAAGDMTIFDEREGLVGPLYRSKTAKSHVKWLALDGNLNSKELKSWTSGDVADRIAFEPVSAYKSTRIISALDRGPSQPFATIDLTTPNRQELRMMASKLCEVSFFEHSHDNLKFSGFVSAAIATECERRHIIEAPLVDAPASIASKESQEIVRDAITLLNLSRCIMVTMGEKGVLMVKHISPTDPLLQTDEAARYTIDLSPFLSSPSHSSSPTSSPHTDPIDRNLLYIRHFPPSAKVEPSRIRSVNGAGDTFTGALIAGLACENPHTEDILVPFAQKAAVITLYHELSVSPKVARLAPVLRGEVHPSSPYFESEWELASEDWEGWKSAVMSPELEKYVKGLD